MHQWYTIAGVNKKLDKTVPVPVRFDFPMRERLRMAANRMGITTSGVIRFAVVQQLRQIESGLIQLSNVSEQVKGGE